MADDYDPFENRPAEQRTTSSFAVFMHLLKAAIGSGILFLPYAFKKTGWITAIVCSFIVGFTSVHTAVLTVQCCQMLCRRAKVPSLNYAETAETAFKLGPEGFRRYAKCFGITTNVIVCFIQYQTLCVYGLYCATSFQQIFDYYTGYKLDIRLYILLIMPIFCALSLVPNFKYLVPFSVIGTFLLFFGFFSSLKYILADWQSPERLVKLTTVDKIPIYCTIFLFAVHNMSMLLPLENSMKKPQQMPYVLASSMLVNIAANVVFGFLGFNKYEEACDTVIKNLPLDEVLSHVIKFAVTLSVLVTYGIHYYIPIKILWPMIAEKVGDEYKYEVCFRLGGVIVTSLLQLAVPQLAQLLGLFSAIGMASSMLLIPVLIEISTKWNHVGPAARAFITIKNIFILFLYIIILGFGSVENVVEMVEEWRGIKRYQPEICG